MRFPWFGLWRLVVVWQYFATVCCVVCAVVLWSVGRVGGWVDRGKGKGKGKGKSKRPADVKSK
ncbi:hypothetical protein BDV98DRAFT_577200 [Pterulicium gracile]|uniref:Uncharacterized protein n=1 Tax=Pterulicium gracile TaxID=1884261 RepID=A0A5C3QBH7_9AGAR|nr:hypothetical protein BDV98DRAFT_577200 [Pterula gracilis]